MFISFKLDNAHIAQSRLILLDAAFIFFMALTIYSYVRFRKLRYWYVLCCKSTHVLISPQGVFGRVVELARCYWILHGLHMGFQGQRYPDGCHYRDCCPDRFMGHIGLSQGLHYG